MTSALVILKDPENAAMALERRLPDAFPGVRFESVREVEAARPFLSQTEVLITLGPHLGEGAGAVFDAAERLKWVQVIGAGVDNVSGHPALRRGVAVTNVTGVHGPQMSEAAFAAMLGFARDVPRLLRNQAGKAWERFPPRLLHGAVVGVLGMGAIAAELAPRCQAFGMRVEGFTAAPRPVPNFDAVYARETLAARAGALDYLVVLTPHTLETHHIIGREVLAAMRPDAVLINLARGGVVDEDALLDALCQERIRGAALDVFATEPLPVESPFWTLPNVIITPHLGGFHAGYADQVVEVVSDNLRRYLDGGAGALRNRVI